ARSLQLDSRSDGLRRREEHRQRLVAAELDDGAAPSLDGIAGQVSERLRQPGRSLVAVLASESRVAPDIRDQERAECNGLIRGLGCGTRDVHLPPAGHARHWPRVWPQRCTSNKIAVYEESPAA